MDVDTVTVLKYRNGKRYQFFVMDKFDEPDEPKRLDMMIAKSTEMANELIDYEELWIKTCPIFPVK